MNSSSRDKAVEIYEDLQQPFLSEIASTPFDFYPMFENRTKHLQKYHFTREEPD